MDEYVNGKHCFDSDLLLLNLGLRWRVALVTALVLSLLILGPFGVSPALKVVFRDDTFENLVVICLRDFG